MKFIGGGAANVPGQTGLDSFTQEQADVAVSVNIDNLASLSFIYEATGNPSSDRNMLIDGGALTTSLESFNTVTEAVMSPAAVPLPASALLMLGGLTALYGARHLGRKRASHIAGVAPPAHTDTQTHRHTTKKAHRNRGAPYAA